MKRIIINIVLLAIIVVLALFLASSIQGPIKFKQEYDKRRNAVVERLKTHRTAQKAFQRITGEFAPNYDTLKQVLLTDSFTIVKVIGDADATDGGEIKKEEYKVSAKDSVATLLKLKSSNDLSKVLDEIEYVPYTDNKKFFMKTDTLTHQKVLVPVIKVHTKVLDFMKEYNDDKFKRYDSRFDVEEELGYGNLSKPTTSGSWD